MDWAAFLISASNSAAESAQRERGVVLMKWVARTMLKEVRRRKKAAWLSSKSTSLSRAGRRREKSLSWTKLASKRAEPMGTPRIETSSRGVLGTPLGEPWVRRGQPEGKSRPTKTTRIW